MSHTTVSTVSCGGIDDKQNAILMKWCETVAEAGGSFAIETFYLMNWQRKYTINWPTKAMAEAAGKGTTE